MTPIKLTDFLEKTAPKLAPATMDLTDIGLLHAAPSENGVPLLSLRFDPKCGGLVPAQC